MIKAIETIYPYPNGDRFRSRIEARWAVFFDTAGIPFDYEKEGVILKDGTRYLPDFWLPEQECWVEIKGKQQPTLGGLEKAEMLSVSGNDVFIFCGQMIQPTQREIRLRSTHLPKGGTAWGCLSATKHLSVRILWFTVEQASRDTGYALDGDYMAMLRLWEAAGKAERDLLNGDINTTITLPFLGVHANGNPYHLELRIDKKCGIDAKMSFVYSGYHWHQCPYCMAWIINSGIRECDRCNGYTLDTEELIEAYRVARQARFEYGETPKVGK